MGEGLLEFPSADGRLVKYARYYWLLLAERHLTQRLFGTMLQRIKTLPLPPGQISRRVGRISGASEPGHAKMSETSGGEATILDSGTLQRART